MEPPALPSLTPQQKYRQSDKCKVARERYYNNKGKAKAHEYYLKNKEVILNRSKERYNQMKTIVDSQNNLENDLPQ
jgi:hypothetical protein